MFNIVSDSAAPDGDQEHDDDGDVGYNDQEGEEASMLLFFKVLGSSMLPVVNNYSSPGVNIS